MRRALALLTALVLALALAACGDDDGDDATDTTTTTEVAGDTSTSASTTEEGDPDGTTTTEEADDGRGPVPDEELPGERIEIYPYEGAELGVVGVPADDVLNVRHGPGTDFGIATALEPLAVGVTATGHNRTLDAGGLWVQVEVDGTAGWVNGAFASHLGDTTDVTSELPGDLGGHTLVDLAEAVAEARAPGGEGPTPRVTIVDGPTVGDLGEVTVDVLGYADDSVAGERLHVFATEDTQGDAFLLRTVEATVLCARGVSGGLCV